MASAAKWVIEIIATGDKTAVTAPGTSTWGGVNKALHDATAKPEGGDPMGRLLTALGLRFEDHPKAKPPQPIVGVAVRQAMSKDDYLSRRAA